MVGVPNNNNKERQLPDLQNLEWQMSHLKTQPYQGGAEWKRLQRKSTKCKETGEGALIAEYIATLR